MSEDRDELERVEELFEFLQGRLPDGYTVRRKDQPKLTADQAWTVIWFLGNQYWQVPDFIERCCVCGDLFNSEAEGDCLDYGNAPYQFCSDCIHTDAFREKMRRNPNKAEREAYFKS